MVLTEQQMADACATIERQLEAVEADPTAVSSLLEARALLQSLRDGYRENRQTMDRHMERLQGYSRRIGRCMSACREALTAEFLSADRAARKAQETRDVCREALLELARTERTDHFESPAGRVIIKQSKTLSLPPAQSPERERLVSIIEQAGRWAEVGQLNPARLRAALNQSLFSPDQAAQIAELCPEKTVFRLATRPTLTESGGG